jgi:tetratricopeptide (TPR) repeat protein
LESELALGSSGLNVAAAQQIIGDMEAAAQTARRCEQFFSRQGLPGYQAQALAIIGTCEAHAEKWDKAGVAWSKALDIDERRHAFIQACERRGLVVQAWVMHDMTTLGHLSERTVKQAEALLVKADSAIERLGDLPDAVQARARLQSVHAQLCLMSKQHVRALRHLSTARELFESMNAQYDVAMVDAFTGLSMIEVGKGANPNVLEEAVLTLQRAHQFFSRPAFPVVRWKVLYYMSLAGLYVSNMQSDPLGRVKWRELSMSWLRSAEQDLAEIADGKTIVSQGGWSVHTEFSPGLEPEAVQVLKRALGVRERSREKRKDSSLEKAPDPGDGYLH